MGALGPRLGRCSSPTGTTSPGGHCGATWDYISRRAARPGTTWTPRDRPDLPWREALHPYELASATLTPRLYILVRMVSAAGTGYCYNIKRARLQEKLVLLKYDPIVNQRVLFTEKRKIRSI